MQKAQNFKGTLLRLIGFLGPEKNRFILMLAMIACGVTLSVIGPRILGSATNVLFEGFVGRMLGQMGVPPGTPASTVVEMLRGQGQEQMANMLSAMPNVVAGSSIDFHALGRILAGVIGLYLLSFLFNWMGNRIMTRAVQNTMLRLRQQVEFKLHRVPLSYIDSQERGEILSRVTNDIDNVAQTMTQSFAELFRNILMVVGVLIMMFTINWQLALIALVTVPLAAFFTMQIAKRSQPQFVEQWASTGRLNSHVEEMFTGQSLVKVYGQRAASAAKFQVENESLYESAQKAQAISGTIMPTMGFVGNLNYVIIAVVGGLKVASGGLTIGGIQAFIQYSRQFTQPISQIAAMMNMLQSGVASAERVFELLDAPDQVLEAENPTRLENVRGRVEFDDVSFSYSPDKPLIENLNLVAEPGETIAIVGPTGAGKTTLVNLIMRFYDVNSGRILLDGVDIRDMTRYDLRSRIGMVLQDTWLFRGTIEDNLKYGVKRPISEEEFLAATKACHVDSFVRTLPDGYKTKLDGEGASLSAGEKQLLTICRAFLADPEILILDEATSSVDTRTEVLVQQAMNALRSGRTSFAIAHRLSTIRDADKIVVMANGHIVEVGNHNELLEQGGAYARLYQSQFEAAVLDEAAVEVDPANAIVAQVMANRNRRDAGQVPIVIGRVPITGRVPIITGRVPITSKKR
ncbi:MAG: ABC transporter ATP-binding protein/permease [Cellulomonadaceae bacterium]|nr:ABC transporter ATP-binding protein/permease [Cellulomonadaceae bacterium]